MRDEFVFSPSLWTWVFGSLIVGVLAIPGMALYKFIFCDPGLCESYLPFVGADTPVATIAIQYLLFVVSFFFAGFGDIYIASGEILS